jgi:hypothetical protein
MSSITERRKYPRSKPDPGSSLRCTTPENPTGENLVTKLIDVSALGACVQTANRLREGMPLQLELTLPGPRGGRFATRGTVRWTQNLEHKGLETSVCGIEFETVVEALAGRSGDSALLDIFLTLRVAVAQLRLYPKESPQVLKVATDTYHSIHSFHDTHPALTMSKTPRGLLVNGRPLGVQGTVADSLESAMLALLEDAQVKSISFKKGLTLDELITFLHALTKKFWDVKDGKEINRRLRDERVLQVTVDEVTYVALGEGDIVIEDAARKLAGGNTELAKLLGNLDQLIDSASQEGMGADDRIHIMKKLLDQDPSLLQQLGESHGEGGKPQAGDPAAGIPDPTGGPAGGSVGASEREEGVLYFERARDAVAEVTTLLRDVPPGFHASLRRVGKIIVDSFRHNPRLMALMGALLSDQAAQAMPGMQSPSAPTEPPAVSRASGILQMPDDERISALAQEGGALLDELGALERPDLIQSLLESLSAYLGDRSSKRRLAACRSLSGLRRAYEKNAPDDMLYALEIGVRSALDQERDGSVYPALADVATFLADLRIRRAGLDRAREILDLLHKHYKIKDPGFPKRGELSYIALEKFAAGSGLASLAGRVRSGDPDAVRIIEAVGAAATRFLIGEIKTAETAADRISLAGFIARAGPGAATVLLDEIAKTAVPSDILRLLEVLPHAMPPDMAEMAMGGLLRHQAVAVRKRTAALVTEQAYSRAGTSLLDAFAAETDLATRIVFVECMGRLRHKAAIDVLAETIDLRSQSEEIRSAACMALGRIGDPRSVPPLVRLLSRGEKGLTKIFVKIPGTVRAAAVRALALFPSNKEAREAVRRAQEDGDTVVRSAANQARLAPLYDAFGDLAQGVIMISNAADLGGEPVKVGGALSEVSYEALCHKLASSERVGLLNLNFGGPVGRIYFDSGVVIAAEYEGRRDQEAFVAMVGRRDGQFLFLPGISAPERRILIPVDSLFEQAMRNRSSMGRGNSDPSIS